MFEVFIRPAMAAEATQYFPYKAIPGVEGIQERLVDPSGNEQIHVFKGKITATGEEILPGDFILKGAENTLIKIPSEIFTREWTKFKEAEQRVEQQQKTPPQGAGSGPAKDKKEPKAPSA